MRGCNTSSAVSVTEYKGWIVSTRAELCPSPFFLTTSRIQPGRFKVSASTHIGRMYLSYSNYTASGLLVFIFSPKVCFCCCFGEWSFTSYNRWQMDQLSRVVPGYVVSATCGWAWLDLTCCCQTFWVFPVPFFFLFPFSLFLSLSPLPFYPFYPPTPFLLPFFALLPIWFSFSMLSAYSTSPLPLSYTSHCLFPCLPSQLRLIFKVLSVQFFGSHPFISGTITSHFTSSCP